MLCFPVFEDNQSGCCTICAEPGRELKFEAHYYFVIIDVRHHFLRELFRQRDIKVVQVPSDFQHADILTKILANDLFAFHPNFLMSLK